jgi:hypothetical protein
MLNPNSFASPANLGLYSHSSPPFHGAAMLNEGVAGIIQTGIKNYIIELKGLKLTQLWHYSYSQTLI